jgi:glycerophosphoryl diester phosphodiesterase
VLQAVREAGLAARVGIQSFDWRTLMILRRIAPQIERVCLTVDGGGGGMAGHKRVHARLPTRCARP